jgi:hypothetical protein
MLLILSFIALFTVQDTTGYDHLSQVVYERNIFGPLRYRFDIDNVNKQLYIYDHKDGKIYTTNSKETVFVDSLDRRYIDDTVLFHDSESNKLIFTDAGGGRVFEYIIDEKRLNRLDNSYRFRTFYGGAYYYHSSNQIFLYGGGGEFLSRNHLIHFNNNSNKEWLEIPLENKPPKENLVYDLYLDLNTKLFLLFTYSNKKNLTIYSAPVEETLDKTWTLVNEFNLNKGEVRGVSQQNNFSNKNYIHPKLNILGNYFYDIKTGELTKWIVENDILGVYKAFNKDSLIVVDTQIKKSDRFNFNPHTYKLSIQHIDNFFVSESFEPIPSIRQQRTQFGLLFFAFLLLFLAGIVLYRKQSSNTSSAYYSESIFSVKPLDNHILVSLNNKNFYFYEEIEIKIFKVIHEIIERDLEAIDLETFDEKVFNGLGHKTHITTKRNEILKRINNKLGFEFITKEKSQEDKRRKFIKISFKHEG